MNLLFALVALVPLLLPNFTAVAPVKLVPVMVTGVPPASGPLVALRPVTVGSWMVVEVNVKMMVPRATVPLGVSMVIVLPLAVGA